MRLNPGDFFVRFTRVDKDYDIEVEYYQVLPRDVEKIRRTLHGKPNVDLLAALHYLVRFHPVDPEDSDREWDVIPAWDVHFFLDPKTFSYIEALGFPKEPWKLIMGLVDYGLRRQVLS